MDGYSASVTSLAIEGSATSSSAVPLWMSSQELSQSLGVPHVSTREILASSVLPGIIIDAPHHHHGGLLPRALQEGRRGE